MFEGSDGEGVEYPIKGEEEGNIERILVCGDREWRNWAPMMRELLKFDPQSVIIEGEARGADWLSRHLGEYLGFNIEPYPANWDQFGGPGQPPVRAAGPIRNTQMLREGKPSWVLAFHEDINKSKGTADMLKQANQRKWNIKPTNIKLFSK